MELEKRLRQDRVVSIRSRDRRGALGELVHAACRTTPGLRETDVMDAVWAREDIVSSWVGPDAPRAAGAARAGLTELMLEHAVALARETRAAAILVQADAVSDPSVL